MPNIQKIEKVDEIVKQISEAKSSAFIQYQGLNAGDIAALRAKIKAAGGTLEVIKNSLLTRALEKLKLSAPEVLTGPTALALSQNDEIAPLKEIDAVNKDKEKTSFKFAVYNGKILSLDELKNFLSLPSKSTLISQFIGGLSNPLQRLSYALRFNQQQLVLALKALSEKKSTPSA